MISNNVFNGASEMTLLKLKVASTMIINRVTCATLLSVGIGLTGVSAASAQVASKGLTPAANTYRSYQNASIVRDSGLSQPLDLLNDFYPAVAVTVSDHDNVRRRPDFQEEDLKITVDPSLAYRTNIGRHQFYAAYNGTFTFHQDIEQEDAESNGLFAKAGLDLSRRWDLDLFGGFGESFEERGLSGGRDFFLFDADSLNAGPEELEYKSFGADLAYGRKLGVLKGVLGFERVETTFDSDDQLLRQSARERDRESDSVHLDVDWQFGARTSLFGRVQYTETDYISILNTLDSEQTDYLIGLRWKPSSALSGVLGVGQSEKDFVDPNVEDYDSDTYYANLNYSLSAFSNIQLAASRQVEEPGDAQSSYYETDFVGVGWTHSLSPRWVVDVYSKWGDDDYNTGRKDNFTDWGIGVDYLWRSWLTAGLYYGEIERESNLSDVDYQDAYFGLRLKSDLRSWFGGSKQREIEPASFDYPKKTGPSQ
ncbi:outer membrane beta-barrel protein [Arenicella xantha]|uniref:Beta-barrel porin 2 n=1 Tax=Arenicella xantha TaxID=644221 RepID=A0A395JHV0_9GAMM|nr:outer membrane beta-barrel protein [Arenicella xantha]RBP49159.1 hypothetical protein DFR28_10485 [Arenicella xantha]